MGLNNRNRQRTKKIRWEGEKTEKSTPYKAFEPAPPKINRNSQKKRNVRKAESQKQPRNMSNEELPGLSFRHRLGLSTRIRKNAKGGGTHGVLGFLGVFSEFPYKKQVQKGDEKSEKHAGSICVPKMVLLPKQKAETG